MSEQIQGVVEELEDNVSATYKNDLICLDTIINYQ